ncbi:hypothetical protein D3C78_1987790 [compost metagenome]
MPPMKLKNSLEGEPSGLENRLRPVLTSTTDWWMCMAEPGCPCIGLAMKVA